MPAKFELKQGKSGQFMFNLKAANGQTILTSEMYKSKRGAQAGIESVRKHAGIDAMYERKASGKNEPYFVLKAANGRTIGKSEMYSSASAMERGIASVKNNAPGAAVAELTG